MQRRTWIIALVTVAACGGKKQEAAPAGPKTYELSIRADKEEPPGGVPVTITWPAGWVEEDPKPSGPRIKIAGDDGVMSGATLILRPCVDDTEGAACIDKWIPKLHDPAKIEQTPVGDRRWVKGTIGKLVVGALWAYHPATKHVVECKAMVKPENADAKLAELRTACEGMTF